MTREDTIQLLLMMKRQVKECTEEDKALDMAIEVLNQADKEHRYSDYRPFWCPLVETKQIAESEDEK